MTEQLKPCPFCPAVDLRPYVANGGFVRCPSCGCRGPSSHSVLPDAEVSKESSAKDVASWNRRFYSFNWVKCSERMPDPVHFVTVEVPGVVAETKVKIVTHKCFVVKVKDHLDLFIASLKVRLDDCNRRVSVLELNGRFEARVRSEITHWLDEVIELPKDET